MPGSTLARVAARDQLRWPSIAFSECQLPRADEAPQRPAQRVGERERERQQLQWLGVVRRHIGRRLGPSVG